jgi:hypothetical protein
MTDSDRATILQALSGRHDELLTKLDALEKQIEVTLTATRPPSTDSKPAASAA